MLLGFPLQRPVFIREYATGTYSSIPYFVSKLATELPTMLVSATLIYLATYWTIGFQGNFFYLVLSTTMLGMVAASYALCIGSAAKNVNVAVQLTPLLFVPQLLFAGLFIAIKVRLSRVYLSPSNGKALGSNIPNVSLLINPGVKTRYESNRKCVHISLLEGHSRMAPVGTVPLQSQVLDQHHGHHRDAGPPCQPCRQHH